MNEMLESDKLDRIGRKYIDIILDGKVGIGKTTFIKYVFDKLGDDEKFKEMFKDYVFFIKEECKDDSGKEFKYAEYFKVEVNDGCKFEMDIRTSNIHSKYNGFRKSLESIKVKDIYTSPRAGLHDIINEIEKLGYHVSSVKDYWSTGEFSESGRWNDDKERCWFVEVQGPNKDIERLAIRALSTGPNVSVDKECYMSVCLESGKR